MAYYTALISKWATAPAGTTQSKLDWINAQIVTGSVPTTFYTTGDQILNCLDKTEFLALTAAQQSNLLLMCSVPGQLLGGSANTSHLVAGMIVAYFTNLQGPTIAALTALAKATVLPWWQAAVANGGGGLSSPVNANDLVKAGNLT
jgi:hypothetical protein